MGEQSGSLKMEIRLSIIRVDGILIVLTLGLLVYLVYVRRKNKKQLKISPMTDENACTQTTVQTRDHSQQEVNSNAVNARFASNGQLKARTVGARPVEVNGATEPAAKNTDASNVSVKRTKETGTGISGTTTMQIIVGKAPARTSFDERNFSVSNSRQSGLSEDARAMAADGPRESSMSFDGKALQENGAKEPGRSFDGKAFQENVVRESRVSFDGKTSQENVVREHGLSFMQPTDQERHVRYSNRSFEAMMDY